MSAQSEKEKKELLNSLSNQLAAAEASLRSIHKAIEDTGLKPEDLPKPSKTSSVVSKQPPKGKIIEGLFDGQNMVGPNNKIYPVPANYASKSKLVEGDLLKLTIADDGSFIYKQIGPTDRQKLIGKLILEDGQYMVNAGGKNYKVLFASVSYFKANPGEEVTIVIPDNKNATWAAIEAVIT